MKLHMTLDRTVNSSPFRPNDEVRGSLEIQGWRSERPPDIAVVFRGKLKVTITPSTASDATISTKSAALILFQETLRLEPDKSAAIKKTDGYFFSTSFIFTFPLSSRHYSDATRMIMYQLPPSLEIARAGIKVKCTYDVTARVPHRWLSRISRSIKRTLEFSPVTPIAPLPTSSIGLLPVDKLQVSKRETSLNENILRHSHGDWLPEYSPVIRVEMTVLRQPILTRGGSMPPLRLMIYAPDEMLRNQSLYVRNLTMQLCSTVTVCIDMVQRRATYTSHLWGARGVFRVDQECFKLDPGGWGMCDIHSPWLTFSSSLLQLAHSLELTIGVSRGTNGQLQYLQASLNVIVADSPPAYEA